MAKRGRPRQKDKRVYSPTDHIELPYAKKDGPGNYFFSYKDENGKWRKLNLGRGQDWFRKYLYYEEKLIRKSKPVLLPPLIPPTVEGDSDLRTENAEGVEEFEVTIDENGKAIVTNVIPRYTETQLADTARNLIRNDPKRASDLLGLPYEMLIGMKLPSNHSLQDVGDNYFKKVEFSGDILDSQKRELAKVRKSWNLFLKTLKTKTVREVNKPAIQIFHDLLYREYKSKKLSTTWIKGHFDRVKRVINAGIRHMESSEDLVELRRLCLLILRPPATIIMNPAKRIKRDEFHKLLEKSNLEERAMWLLSMNCAYYSVDVANLPVSAIDFDEKTLVYRRRKREKRGGGHRAAVLWDITVNTVKEHLSQKKGMGHDYVFTSSYGVPYIENRIRKKFVDVRTQAGLNHLKHSHFRDSVESIGQLKMVHQNSINAVMGQRPQGNIGNYVDPELVPEIAKPCCEAVYAYYFG